MMAEQWNSTAIVLRGDVTPTVFHYRFVEAEGAARVIPAGEPLDNEPDPFMQRQRERYRARQQWYRFRDYQEYSYFVDMLDTGD